MNHHVKNINGSFEIDEYVEWNAFETLLNGEPLPEQIFFLFKFHEFFDGLIGYETLRNLNAVINAADNSLLINNVNIKMQKKFPRMIECHFQESVLYKPFPTPLKSGDFYIQNDLLISPNIKIPSGIYRADNNQAVFPLINSGQDVRTVSIDIDSIPLDLCSFEEISPPINQKKVNRRLAKRLDLRHLNQEEKSNLMKVLAKHENCFYHSLLRML